MSKRETKLCEGCSREFERPKDYSAAQWQSARFCSHPCFCKARRERKKDERAVFESLTAKSDAGCWLWMGCLHREGYGQISINRVLKRAHRLSYELHYGPIPDGMGVLHKCDNPRCVRPDHLYIGTAAENGRDMVVRGRSLIGARNHATKLSAEIVRAIRTSTLTDAELARSYGVSRPAVRNARLGKTWGHVT